MAASSPLSMDKPVSDSGLNAAPAAGEMGNSSAIKGEAGTGFEKAGDLGEFECGNCSFFDTNACHQGDMMQKSTQPKNPDGSVQVEAEDCCEFVDRQGSNKQASDTSGMTRQGNPAAEHPLQQLRAKPKRMGL